MSGYSADASSYPHHPNPPPNQHRQFGTLGQQQQQQHPLQPISYNPQTPTENNQTPQQQQSFYQHNGHNIPPNGHDMQQQAPSAAPTGSATPANKNGQPKQGRLGRACDSCSQRKVKVGPIVPLFVNTS